MNTHKGAQTVPKDQMVGAAGLMPAASKQDALRGVFQSRYERSEHSNPLRGLIALRLIQAKSDFLLRKSVE